MLGHGGGISPLAALADLNNWGVQLVLVPLAARAPREQVHVSYR